MKARSGQALVEYVMVTALVAVALIASLMFLRQSIGKEISELPNLENCGPAEVSQSGAPSGSALCDQAQGGSGDGGGSGSGSGGGNGGGSGNGGGNGGNGGNGGGGNGNGNGGGNDGNGGGNGNGKGK